MVKNLLAVWETWVRSLGREDPLEKELATHSSVLAWEIPWTEEPGGPQSIGSQRVGHEQSDLAPTPFHTVSMSLFSMSASPQRMDTEILVHIHNGKQLSF